MKDLLEKVLAHIPKYVRDLMSVLSGPKSFLRERNRGTGDELEQALIFLGMTFSLVFLIQFPLLYSGREFWAAFATQLGILLLTLVLAAFALRLAWKCVGGKATAVRLLETYCYLSGGATFLLIVPLMMSLLVLKEFVPYAFQVSTTLRDDAGRSILDPDVLLKLQAELALHPQAELAYTVLHYIGLSLVAVFAVIGWGAYREINGVSKAKSALAFVLLVIFCVPVGVAIGALQLLLVGR